MEGGAWGLIICVSAFMIQVFTFGCTFSIGVYNIELLEYFDNATVGVSLIGSLNYGIFLGTGPMVSFLMTKFSYRKIALFGSALVVLGVLGMPLLPYLPAMWICFGLLTGFGSACSYIPSHVLSGLYYDKYRSFATGVVTSGSGFGGAFMPIVVGLLIQHYSWKGSLIVLGGLTLHLFVFSALLRAPPIIEPIEFTVTEGTPLTKEAVEKKESEEDDLVDCKHECNNATGVPLLGLDADAETDKALDYGSGGLPSSAAKQIAPVSETMTKTKKEPKTSRHFFIFTNYGFDIFFLSNITWNAASSIVNVFVPDFLQQEGDCTAVEAAFLIGVVGFGCFIGCICGGLLGNLKWVNRLVLYTAANFTMGLGFIAVPFVFDKTLYAICLLVAGFSFGIILGLLVIVLTDLVGVESLSNGLGYLLLSNGVGTFLGPPIAGYIQDVTDTYSSGIILSGVLCIIGGLVMFLMPMKSCIERLLHCEPERENQDLDLAEKTVQ